MQCFALFVSLRAEMSYLFAGNKSNIKLNLSTCNRFSFAVLSKFELSLKCQGIGAGWFSTTGTNMSHWHLVKCFHRHRKKWPHHLVPALSQSELCCMSDFKTIAEFSFTMNSFYQHAFLSIISGIPTTKFSKKTCCLTLIRDQLPQRDTNHYQEIVLFSEEREKFK